MTDGSRTIRNHMAAVILVVVLACNLPSSLATPVRSPSGPSTATAPAAGSPSQRPAATLPPIVDWQLTVDEVLAQCPAAVELDAIDAKIKMSFESDPTAGKLVCTAAAGSADLTRLQKNAYNAILIMKRLEFDAPLPWTDQPLYDWFVSTIRAIRFRSDIQSHSCCGTPPTINIKTELQALYSERWSAVGKLTAIYVHEARHTFKAHQCSGRDNTIAEMGALGVELSLYRWLAYHSDPDFLTSLDPGPTDDYRQAARWNAYALEKSGFCAEPTPGSLPAPLTVSLWAKTPVATDRMAAASRSGVPVPVLLSPAGDVRVDPRGRTFTWGVVDYPGGVTYSIEIDSFFSFNKDWQFWEARTDERGLASPSYTLPLPFDGYAVRGRWRVWATSPAAGDGPKSDWRYFELGPR